jgi:hypothetical protein
VVPDPQVVDQLPQNHDYLALDSPGVKIIADPIRIDNPLRDALEISYPGPDKQSGEPSSVVYLVF